MEQREVDNMLLSMIQKHFPSLPLSDEHTDWGKWLGFARAVYEAGRASPASVPANADLTGAKASALKAQLYGENMMTIECDFEGFKRMAKEFHDAAPTLNLDELDNAWKCLGLGYLGMNEPMWQHSAATLLKMEARTFAERESALTYNFKLVPVEPTMEMCEAGWNEYDLQEHFSVRFMYERMIAAAPTPPVSEDRWQPIETAPKDKFVLLAGPSGYTTIEIVYATGRMCSDYHVGRWIDHANDDLTDWGFEPTHWMPLPKAPTMRKDKS